MESYLSVDVRDEADATVLTVSGELDMASSPRLADALNRLDPPPRWVIVDLAELEFMDLIGLQVLLQAKERTRESGARLTVVNASRAVRRLLKLTRTTELLDAHKPR